MIMPRGQPLLLPANPVFIAASLLAALALNMLPLGRLTWQPDWLALVLAFWALHQSGRVGMGLAFVLGVCMDVAHASLLGQHALAYALLVFVCGAAPSRDRLRWFSTPVQALHLLALFALLHALQMALRLLAGGIFPGMALFLAPAIEALLWPLVSALLLAPQRLGPIVIK